MGNLEMKFNFWKTTEKQTAKTNGGAGTGTLSESQMWGALQKAIPELQEIGLADLELRREDIGWIKLGVGDLTSTGEITESKRIEIVKRARYYWHLDPLAKQAVRLWTDYALGTGLTWRAKEEGTQRILSEFWNSRKNRSIFGSSGQRKSSRKLLVDGEVFFAIFPGAKPEQTILRRIDPLQIKNIVTDPEDEDTVLVYKREFTTIKGEQVTRYYRDWTAPKAELIDEQGKFLDGANVAKMNNGEDILVYHLPFETIGHRGNSLLAPVIDWLKSYRQFMASRIAIIKALAIFAWKQKIKGGATEVETARTSWESNYATGGTEETNPPPAPASTWVENEGSKLEPIKTETGGRTARADGDMIKLQVSAGTTIMLHYFGDPSTGNLATATAMELPMLKAFQSYQTLWSDFYQDIFGIVLERAKVPEEKRFTDRDYPPIVEADAPKVIEAIKKLLEAIPELNTDEIKTLALTTLKINNVDEILKKLKENEPSEEAKSAALIAQLKKFRKQTEKPDDDDRE